MTDTLDPAATIEAARGAAEAGDYHRAERLLRDAAAAQEVALGADHPDLASTLNNLAYVCERTNNLTDAERHYRRAHAIAVASLGPRHPFVATSVKNLVDFCAAHQIPIWTPPHAKPATAAPPVDSSMDTPPITGQAIVRVEGSWRMPFAIGLGTLALVLIATVVFTGMRSRETTTPNSAPPPPVTTPSLTPTPSTVEPDAITNTTPARADRRESRDRNESTTEPRSITVLSAQLCKGLQRRGAPDWQCTSARGDLRPGTYIFYTRLLARTATTVEHRWYRGDRVHQVMRLQVPARPGTGFRTFSSNTVSRERAGDWTVELRAADGTVLQEEHFVIHP